MNIVLTAGIKKGRLGFYIQLLLLSFFTVSIFSSCEFFNPHNIPDELTQTNFVNKSSIYLLGRKPYYEELRKAKQFFSENGFTQSSREEYLLKISASEEYKLYMYQLARNDLMNFIFNPDSTEIQNTINVWTDMHPDEYGRKEIIRLKKLQTIPRDLLKNNLDNISLHKRLINNSYYDFINMGTENFVISMYNNFLDRSPTNYELIQGKLMVDSSRAFFLGLQGDSKEDFISLFFESFPYYEGQVRMLYKRYYFSEPSAEFLTKYTLEYSKQKDLRKIQAKLLSMDAFISS